MADKYLQPITDLQNSVQSAEAVGLTGREIIDMVNDALDNPLDINFNEDYDG